jgi:SpoVK/Ycf46/Vps4 family AAA+-type ATPase
LTQIDQLRSLPNILYITTSNFPSLVDSAFIDRVDWSFHVSLPSERIIYSLLLASIGVMKGKGLLKGADELASTSQAAQLIGGPSQDLFEVCKSLVVTRSIDMYLWYSFMF